jgi:hypothetical protein
MRNTLKAACLVGILAATVAGASLDLQAAAMALESAWLPVPERKIMGGD